MSWRSKMGSAMESELAIELLEVVVLKNGSEMVSLRGLDPELGKLVILLEHYRDRSSVVMVSAAADVPDERFWPIARRVEELFAA